MSFWRDLFGLGTKGVEFHGNTDAQAQVIGYPGWPIFDSYGSMYRMQPAVRTVVDFLADNGAQVSPKIFARIDDTNRRPWNDHPLAELLRRPNPSTSRFVHFRDTFSDLAIYDVAYWRKLRARGLTRGFLRLPPSRVQVEFDRERLTTVFRFNGEIISRDELVVFHGYHPDGGDQGVSPLETLRRVLSEEWAATTHREWYWRNAARHSGVIERPKDAPKWSPEAKDRFRRGWETTHSGGVNSGRTAILEDGMTWHTSSFSPKDSEYIEARKLHYIEVARVYAPSLAGLLGEEGKTATESFHRQLYQDALQPMMEMIEGEIDVQLLTLDEFNMGTTAYCAFNLADKLKGSFEERNRALVSAVGVPYLTINEARTMDDRTPVDAVWADIPVQPMNVLYGGQPAVTVPTEVPEPRGAAAEFESKFAAFLDRQQESICSRVGGLENQGELTVYVGWDGKRWDRELFDLFEVFPWADARAAAAETNLKHRDAAAQAYAEGGLAGIRQVFSEAKARAADYRPRQPALTA